MCQEQKSTRLHLREKKSPATSSKGTGDNIKIKFSLNLALFSRLSSTFLASPLAGRVYRGNCLHTLTLGIAVIHP
jgi:hypothetical protein